jgi:hypothetical protein
VESVVLVPSLDECDDEGVFPMDMDVVSKRWVAAEFSNLALSRHFGQARDYPTPFFETFSQYRLYRGGVDTRLMHTEQQWLSWPCLEIFVYMNSLVDFLKAMGWKKILEFGQDWNKAIIWPITCARYFLFPAIQGEKDYFLIEFSTH